MNIYARITALTHDEDPVEQIEGKITGGSISIDGTSSLRRVCSLTMIALDINITEFYWGIKTKFRLEIGTLDLDDITWYPQGIFLINSFNTSYSTSAFTIAISGQDKMCLLNGTVGGALPASIDFGQEEAYDVSYIITTFDNKTTYEANKYYYLDKNGNYVKSFAEYGYDNEGTKYGEKMVYYTRTVNLTLTKVPLKTIIREAVHAYANEPYYNIIINDLDETGLELLEYRGEQPLYFLYNEDATICENVLLLNSKLLLLTKNDNGNWNNNYVLITDLDDSYFDTIVEVLDNKPCRLKLNNGLLVRLTKCTYGDTVGYRITDLVYTGDLITLIGETITTGVLDKIVTMLGDYLYYYNTLGLFVFERKATYLNTSWNSLVNTKDDIYAENAAQASLVIYNFEGNSIVSSISHNPQITNIKNDFSVFGERKGVSNNTIPVHMRIAIDEKPEFYRAFDGTYYYANLDDKDLIQSCIKKVKTDWREIIYQMALDFYAHNQEDDFLVNVSDNNKYYKDNEYFNPFPIGLTGYEQYYIDMLGFWRLIYNPDPEITYSYTGGKYEEVKTELEDSNKEGAYTIETKWVSSEKVAGSYTCDFYLPKTCLENGDPDEYFTTNPDYYYWNRNVIESPDVLNFWIDFIDTEGELGKYSVKAIGDRTKTVNDKDVKSIYYKSIPNVIFFSSMEEYLEHEIKTGYLYVIMSNDFMNLFTLSTLGKSAKDAIDTLLYTHTYAAETINLSVITIYDLEPNNRISVFDEHSNINDEYVINKISIPLGITGTMTIEGAKAPQRLY